MGFESEIEEWDYILNSKLAEYIPAVHRFWDNITSMVIHGTGVYPVQGDDVPPGLMYRMTNTPARSPIKGVQVFPFVPVPYLHFTNVPGGASRMVSKVCAGGRFMIDGFVIVEKSKAFAIAVVRLYQQISSERNLPATYHQGQFLAFIPEEVYSGARDAGRWIYFKLEEMQQLCSGNVPFTVKQKLIKCI